MAPKIEGHSFEFRNSAIKQFLNDDSEHEIAKKELLRSRNIVYCIIDRYKKTKCIGNIFGRGRKRKTTLRVDKLIQRKVKVNLRKSASSVRQELGITIFNQTVRHCLIWACGPKKTLR